MTVLTQLFGKVDRERLLDMDERIQPMRRNTVIVLAATALLCAPWEGWWPAGLGAVATVFIMFRRSRTGAHPEYQIFAGWILIELIIAGVAALGDRSQFVTLSWLAIPVLGLPCRFSTRIVVVGVALALALVLAVGLGVDSHAILDNPGLVAQPAALIICVALLSTVLMRSDIEHRDDSVLDQLTGMLNRRALAARSKELTEQSAARRLPIAVIVGDLDHFKTINDTAGHTTGDAVLADVAYRLRKQLRAFDLAYRIGGEEFVVLAPGADLGAAGILAEELRAAVAAQTVGDGRTVTMSFGVSASALGETFSYEDVFTAADAALYQAKQTGRDRVCVSADGATDSSPVPA